MAYSNIRSALNTRLSAITGVENAQSYHRLISRGVDDATFTSLFVADGVLHAWRFTRTSVAQALCNGHDSTVKRTHTIEIECYRSVVDDDASEHTFQDLIDTVLDDFGSGDRTLGGVAETHDYPQVTRILAGMFYNVACHIATITMRVEENI